MDNVVTYRFVTKSDRSVRFIYLDIYNLLLLLLMPDKSSVDLQPALLGDSLMAAK